MTDRTSRSSSRRFVAVGALQIRLFENDDRDSDDATSDAASTLVLLHGAGGNYLQWPPQLRRIPGLRVLAPDLSGHGDSTGDAYTNTRSYASDIGNLLDTIKVSSCIAAGFSMGAAILMELAHRDPDRIIGLGILAAGERLFLSDEHGRMTGREIMDAAYRTPELSAGTVTSADLHERQRKWFAHTDIDLLRRDFEASRTFDAQPYAATLHAPAMIVAGDQDRLVPVSSSRALHDRMPSSELHVLDGAGHMFLWERAWEIRALIWRLSRQAHDFAGADQQRYG